MLRSRTCGRSQLRVISNLSDNPKKFKSNTAHCVTLILSACGLLYAGSCTTPIAVGPCYFGVGLYEVDSRLVNPDVDYCRIEGVGALFADGRLSLGYADHQCVHAHMEGRNYLASTPLVDFAVGEDSQKAGIEFVFPNNLSPERSE